jgi:protein-S-isoprenylcysteine O-methyltransferase Ste14
MIIKISVFAVLALLVLIVFKGELRSLTSHGFYMFFAFESLLALLFFNVDSFVFRVFPWYQILSWILLVISALLAFSGFYGLKKFGKPVEGWEETTELIRRGIFRYIRHPLYSSLILLAVGILLKNMALKPFIACFVCISFLVTASIIEEKENLAKFGDSYHAYANDTRRYIPFIF